MQSHQWLPEATRRTGKRAAVFCVTVSVSKKRAQSPFFVQKFLWFFWHLLRTKSWCVFRVLNHAKWIPCPNSGECWSKLPRKAQRGAGMAKLCRTRAEQVEQGPAEPCPAPAGVVPVCSIILPYPGPQYTRMKWKQRVRLLWTRMTVHRVKCFVCCRHLSAVGAQCAVAFRLWSAAPGLCAR